MEEKLINPVAGTRALLAHLLFWSLAIAFFYVPALGSLGWLLVLLALLAFRGYFSVRPGQGRVLMLFGNYYGSVRKEGFYWTNPLVIKKKVDLRGQVLSLEIGRVPEKNGAPVAVGLMVVWQVGQMAHFVFSSEHPEQFLEGYTRSLLRGLIGAYPLEDDGQPGKMSLRTHINALGGMLKKELNVRMQEYGLSVEEVRFTHLTPLTAPLPALLQPESVQLRSHAAQAIAALAAEMTEKALQGQTAEGTAPGFKEQLMANLMTAMAGQLMRNGQDTSHHPEA